MARGRAWLTGALVSIVAIAGMAVTTVSPAGATPGNTTVSCALEDRPDVGGPVQHCTFTDPEGIRTIRARDIATGSVGGSDATFICHLDPSSLVNSDYVSFPPTNLKITITDCEHPRSHATFLVRADGTVREIRNI